MAKHALRLSAVLVLLGFVGCATPEDLSRNGQWNLLEYEIERAPIFDSSLHWEVVYDEEDPQHIAVGDGLIVTVTNRGRVYAYPADKR